jgi:beta-glucanase (GH16 family)
VPPLRTIAPFALLLTLPLVAQPVAAPPRLDRVSLGERRFAEEFSRPPSISSSGEGTRWKSQYFFGSQTWQDSRTLPGEEQVYVDPAWTDRSPFRHARGWLTIQAERAPADARHAGKRFTSGLISTERSFAQRYGYFEARMTLPVGRGVFPAFWLFNRPGTTFAEIDIVEHVGSEPGTIHCTAQWRDEGGVHRSRGFPVRLARIDRPHVYGLWWSATTIAWYVDGVEVARMDNPGIHEPLYVIANLAMGGKWGGSAPADIALPKRLAIDWIRVYALRK